MVLHINEKTTVLPFELLLEEGIGSNKKYMAIDQLAVTPTFHKKYVYYVTEYKNLMIQCKQTTQSLSVIIKRADDDTEKYDFSKNEARNKVIFDSKHDSYYPWPCGYYMFTVTTGLQVFYGWLKIVPKNFDEDQLFYIHEALNTQLQNLAFNMMNEQNKITNGSLLFHESRFFMEWLDKYEHLIFSSVSYIEQHHATELINHYEWGKRPERQTMQSYKKQVLHPEKAWMHLSYNRKIQSTNSKEGLGFVKYFLQELLFQIKKLKDYLPERQEVYQKASKYEKKCLHCLASPIFYQVQADKQLRVNLMKKNGYATLYQLYRDFKAKNKKENFSLLKPTPVLYEYYCYFVVLHVLKSLGFRINHDFLLEQLERYFKNNELEDGATVILKRGTRRLSVIFNDRLKTYYQLHDETGLFSQDERRKPDIRIDIYEKEVYTGSIIVEVKYRPFQNIYRYQDSYTDAMKQMDCYWLIKRKGENNRFDYHPIKQVICLFPGSEIENEKTHSPVGIFIPMFPKVENGVMKEIIGEKGLTTELENWINE